MAAFQHLQEVASGRLTTSDPPNCWEQHVLSSQGEYGNELCKCFLSGVISDAVGRSSLCVLSTAELLSSRAFPLLMSKLALKSQPPDSALLRTLSCTAQPPSIQDTAGHHVFSQWLL